MTRTARTLDALAGETVELTPRRRRRRPERGLFDSVPIG